jgi:hypothetical protein
LGLSSRVLAQSQERCDNDNRTFNFWFHKRSLPTRKN